MKFTIQATVKKIYVAEASVEFDVDAEDEDAARRKAYQQASSEARIDRYDAQHEDTDIEDLEITPVPGTEDDGYIPRCKHTIDMFQSIHVFKDARNAKPCN